LSASITRTQITYKSCGKNTSRRKPFARLFPRFTTIILHQRSREKSVLSFARKMVCSNLNGLHRACVSHVSVTYQIISRTASRHPYSSVDDPYCSGARVARSSIAQFWIWRLPSDAGDRRNRTRPPQHPVAFDQAAQTDGRGLPQRLHRGADNIWAARRADRGRHAFHVHGRIFVGGKIRHAERTGKRRGIDRDDRPASKVSRSPAAVIVTGCRSMQPGRNWR
jgi:hypothetical protein